MSVDAPPMGLPLPAHEDAPGAAGVQAPPWYRRVGVWDRPVPRGHPDVGPDSPWLWWLGVTGGAGVTTLTCALPWSGDALRRCPGVLPGESPYVVAVTRAHVPGLARAQNLARQHAVGMWPPRARLLGLVTVADSPKRLDADTRRYRRLVASAFARSWHVPWVVAWRHRYPSPSEPLPLAVDALAADLAQIVEPPRATERRST